MSQQSQTCQFFAQRTRHFRHALQTALQVCRRFIRRQIAPPLKRSARLPLCRDYLMRHHDLAAADAILARHRAQVDDLLAALDIALDDPIQRPAVNDLVLALGKHARDMMLLDRKSIGPLPGRILIAPFNEIFNRVTANSEFEYVQSHKLDLGQAAIGFNRNLLRSLSVWPKIRCNESNGVTFENRSGAYVLYVSTGSAEGRISWPLQ